MVNVVRLNQLADELRSHPKVTDLDRLADRLRRTDQPDQAEQVAQDCIEMAKRLEDSQCEGIGRITLGLVYHAKAQFELAVRTYEEAQRNLHLEADDHGEAVALVALGLAYHDRCLLDSMHQWPSAFAFFVQGIELMQRLTERTRSSKQFLKVEDYERTIAKFQWLRSDVYREYVLRLSDRPKQSSASRLRPPNGQVKKTPPPKQLTLRAFPVFDRIAAGQQFTLTGQPEETHIVLREVEIDGVVFQPVRIEPRRFAVQHLDPKSVYFGIRVKGESMIGLGIEPGDVALVRQGGDVDDGQVAAVRIGDEATLKRVFARLGYVRLQPENDAEPSIIVAPDSQMESDVRQRYSEADGYKILVEPDIAIIGPVVAVFKPVTDSPG